MKGMLSGSGFGLGIRCCWGEWRVDGDHLSQARMSLTRSAAGSETHPHSLGHGFPPNVSLRARRRKEKPSINIWVIDWMAVCGCKC